MGTVKIVTDSTAYLPEDFIREYGIGVARLYVKFQGKQFPEGTKYTDEEFFSLVRQSPELPTTSQPSPGDFVNVYQQVSSPGDTIISIHISSGISGTVSSARVAAEMLPDRRIWIIDSLSTAGGLAIMVQQAARMARQGSPAEVIVKSLGEMIAQMRLYFMVESLEYLRRGGRIGGAAALVGSILQVKPLLYLKGEIGVLDKVRTRSRAVIRLVEEAVQLARSSEQPYFLGAIHVDDPQEGESLRQQLQQELDREVTLFSTGPVIGSHVGPGTLGFAFCPVPGPVPV